MKMRVISYPRTGKNNTYANTINMITSEQHQTVISFLEYNMAANCFLFQWIADCSIPTHPQELHTHWNRNFFLQN